MRNKFLMSLLFSIISLVAMAQNMEVKGIVTDKSANKPLIGATVQILNRSDSSVVRSAVADVDGKFSMNVPAGRYILTVESMDYQQYVSFFSLENTTKDFATISLARQGKDLAGVTVVAKAPPVVNKQDTAQFSASQFKVNPDATTEDLIKKMPGITVAKDGTVTAQGETVKKVTIDGKDFFGDDASAALKNLPSEVVDKIQVFDRMSDQAQLTGVDDGNSVKAINVVTKTGVKNGQFGRVYVGGGTNERYQAGGNISFFKGDRRVSFVGNFNNINQQNFGSQDLLGLTSSGRGGGGNRGGGGGMMGGGMMGGFGGGNNFLVGQSNGISSTNAFGINYSDVWNKKINVSGSYFFNNSNNNNLSGVATTYTNALTRTAFSETNSNATTYNTNHRINMRMEYKIDSNNSLFFIPSVSFQKNTSNGYYDSRNLYTPSYSLDSLMSNTFANRQSSGYNMRYNLMYRRNLAKKGRSIMLGMNTNFTKNSSENINKGTYRFWESGIYSDSIPDLFADNLTNGQAYTLNLNYTEPLGKFSFLQFEYNPGIQKNKADQKTYNFNNGKYGDFDSTLSNKFDNTVTTHNGGVSYRYNPNRDNMLMLGLNAQSTRLESDRTFPTLTRVDQSFFNLLPRAMWRKKLGQYGNLRTAYFGRTDVPSVNQLQDVVNTSNSLNVSVGNPGLKTANSNMLMGRYSWANSKTSRSFFLMGFGQLTSNYIANGLYVPVVDSVINGSYTLAKGTQLSKPVNLKGYKTLRTMATYVLPVKTLKSNLSVNTGYNYTTLPGLSNNVEIKTYSSTFNAGIGLASNISEFVDFNLSYNANFSNAKTFLAATTTNTKYVNHVSNLTLNLLNKQGWFLQNDVTNQIYNGLSASFDQTYWLWNAAVGKKFLKSRAAELKLSVFDLLKQNQSLQRTVNANYIEDARYNVLQQYFMLTFTYNLKNFGKPKPTNNRESNNDGPRGPMMGPMGGHGAQGGPMF